MASVKRLPFGLRINIEKNGLIGAGCILLSWIWAHTVVYHCIALPTYKEGLLPYPLMICYMWIGACTLISFFRSMFSDPGRVLDVPTNKVLDWSYWEKCPKCVKPRPPRSHHCSKCGQCILKMDHHCMWINNCVGAGNHWIFVTLLCYAFLCACINSYMYFHYISTWKKMCLSCNKLYWVDLTSTTTMTVAYLLSFVLIIGPCLLLITNYINVLNDRTSLENMTESSFFVAAAIANSRSKSNNFLKMLSNVCGTYKLLWIFPFRRRPFSLTNFSGLKLSNEVDV